MALTIEDIERYEAEDGNVIKFPRKRIVCTRCNGNGWVDSWEGGFTDADVTEWYGADRDEFIEDYKRGRYGVTCPECKGKNVVDVIDEDYCSKELLDLYHSHMKAYYEVESISRTERMMGA
jgi:hypothetical protein